MQGVVIAPNPGRMGEIAGFLGELVIYENARDIVDFILPTGGTPVPMYEYWIERYGDGKTDFSNVRTRNLDEYEILDLRDYPQSYRYYMDTMFFDHVNIDRDNTHVPNGVARDLEQEAERYEALNLLLGPAQLTYLGIGPSTCHMAFNEPPADFNSRTHVATLDESTIQANARFFDGERERVPKRAITMGIGTIRNYSKTAVLMATDNKQQEITKTLRCTSYDPWIPASALRTMDYVLYVITEGAVPEDFMRLDIDTVLKNPTDSELRRFLETSDFLESCYAEKMVS
jgi:glucosamine-6-phosphate deaminase